MKLKFLLTTILVAVSVYSSPAQHLHKSYQKRGTVNAAGGPSRYIIMIELKAGGNFVYHQFIFAGSGRRLPAPLSQDLDSGTWKVKGDTLYLNRNSNEVHSNEIVADLYLIRKKQLRRITHPGEKEIYRATSARLMRNSLCDEDEHH